MQRIKSTGFSAFSSSSSGLWCVAIGAFMAVICGLTHESKAADAEEALRHGRAGLAEYDRGNWQVALEEVLRADSIMHSPVFGLYAARCLQNLNRWVEAKQAYEAVVQHQIDSNAPAPWRQAAESAKSELAALKASLPSVVVVIETPPGDSSELDLLIDNRKLDHEHWNNPLDLSPGTHEFTLRQGARTIASQSVVLHSGDQRVIVVMEVPAAHEAERSVAPPTRQAATPPSAASRQNVPVQVRASEHPFRTAGTVALGLGALGMAAGIAAGLWAWHERDALFDQCGGYQCPQEYKSRWQHAHGAATVATAAIVVSGIDLAVGTYLFYATSSTGARQGSGNGASRDWSLGVVTTF